MREIQWMDDFLDKALNMDLSDSTKFQCMKVLRNELVELGFSESHANLMACEMKLEVSDDLWSDYQEEITAQLLKFAKIIDRLFSVCAEEFMMDVDMFIKTFAKDLSYSMTN